MVTFLPADYKAPNMSNHYMKLQPGENRLRILSRPIMGWEDWIDNKPVRYRMDQKPAAPFNPDKPIKHFWACIVYNYLEKAIQIYQITQASIRKQLEHLCKDEDWGAPYFYDIKITKTGNTINNTEYTVNPLPHKPVSEEIVKLFHTKPCNLEALYEGADPFSNFHEDYTPGIFTKPKELELQPAQVQAELPWDKEQDHEAM